MPDLAMPTLASAIDRLIPAAQYYGSMTADTQDAFDALEWIDARPKPSIDKLIEVREIIKKEKLKMHAADVRWERQDAGFTYRGKTYNTSFESPIAFALAFAMANANPSYSTLWKLADGTFTTVNAEEIKGLFKAYIAFKDALFAAEARLAAAIDGGTVTSRDQMIPVIKSVANSK